MCEHCSSGPVLRRLCIRSLGPLLVVHLKLFEFANNVPNKITNLKVPKVPLTNLKLDGHMYRPVCGVFHLGTKLYEGHYVAYLRQGNSWLCTDDNTVAQSKWPYNAKGLMLLVLKKN
jgi:ubiquitin C-terminal hydrolase